MAVKYYAQIDFDLFSEPVFRNLSSNDVRFIYLTAHCSKLSNYLGLFRYPKEIWSYDANVKPVEIDVAIAELEDSGLVEYDAATQTIRLVDWFKTLNAPANGNQMKGHIKSFRGLSQVDEGMLCRSVADFTVSSFIKAVQWELTSPEHGKINEAFRPFLSSLYFRFGDLFSNTLQAEIDASGRETQRAIEAVFHLLPSIGTGEVKPFRKGCERVSQQEKKEEDRKTKNQRTNPAVTKDQRENSSVSKQAKESKLALEARQMQS
ncbi:hypothetical protein MWU61_01665 [Loktanella sp. F6476L]|uniref:hypothetical protein n=1 Tax=Loktanella sp. F6476L TaxID=2926405 RepID=UPI001FF4ACE0|nr:hypothetical protein [Loktanella sp. F6476L]MCK0119231.1 hypothetical protein [Loktanella sp. F6476L]